MGYREEYERWIAEPSISEEMRTELLSIKGNDKEIEDRFYMPLDFGTAGLRGVIGAGTNRMNVYVIRQTTQGFAEYLLDQKDAKERGVAIAYDSRNMSPEFATETALVLANNGVKAYLYKTLHSVPQLSYTIKKLNCAAGVVITASHNPPQYNGYKVYCDHGGQADPETASAITEKIRKTAMFSAVPMDMQEAIDKGLLVMIGEEIDAEYYKEIEKLQLHKELTAEQRQNLKIVYTPLHGSGAVPVKAALTKLGIGGVYIVPEQEAPDGNFPTVKAPNPEDKDAFTLAIALANKVGANAILATDPDSDRLGVCVRRDSESFDVLTGNQIGSLLLHYILTTKKQNGTLPNNGVVLKSIVSTYMADTICKEAGVICEEVLTGFRFIAERMHEYENTKARTFLFGFEESYGFLAGTYAKDKDAISSAMLVAEACIYYATQGKTLTNVLSEMYEQYGYFIEDTKSYSVSGKDGMERVGNAMTYLRENVPYEFGGKKVLTYEDFKSGVRQSISDGKVTKSENIELPKSNVLRYFLEGGTWVSVRPSGTEPKLKLYTGINAKTKKAADELRETVRNSAISIIDTALGE